jgi:hypothetical protein
MSGKKSVSYNQRANETSWGGVGIKQTNLQKMKSSGVSLR